MALDNTGGFTIGGLDNAPGGNAARLLHCAFELTGLNDTGTYVVDKDGGITASDGGATADLAVQDGAGFTIQVTIHDPNQTGGGLEGATAAIKVTFGSTESTAPENFTIVGAFVSAGLDDTGGTAGSLAISHMCVTSVSAISANSVTFGVAELTEDGTASQAGDAAQGYKIQLLAVAIPNTI